MEAGIEDDVLSAVAAGNAHCQSYGAVERNRKSSASDQ
jgi:hypothetical protein